MGLKPPPELVEHLRADLERLEAAKAAQPDPKKRRQSYRDFIKACDTIIEFVGMSVSPYVTDRGRTLPPLAELISATGFRQLFGLTSGWSIRRLPHEGLVREVRTGRDDDCSEFVFVMDQLTLERRTSVALETSPLLVQKLIAEIKQPVQRLLDIEMKGGRPRDAVRRHIIHLARLNYRHLTGEKPTKDPAGGFVEFCHDLCVELKVEVEKTDSLGSLVAEILHPRVRNRTTKTK